METQSYRFPNGTYEKFAGADCHNNKGNIHLCYIYIKYLY